MRGFSTDSTPDWLFVSAGWMGQSTLHNKLPQPVGSLTESPRSGPVSCSEVGSFLGARFRSWAMMGKPEVMPQISSDKSACRNFASGWSANRKLGTQPDCCSVTDNWRLVGTVRRVEFRVVTGRLVCFLCPFLGTLLASSRSLPESWVRAGPLRGFDTNRDALETLARNG